MATTRGRRPVGPKAAKSKGDGEAQAARKRYSKPLADRICGRLAEGEPLSRICRDEDMAAYSTVYVWERRYPEFGEQLVQAREAGARACADRAMTIAEDSTKETATHDRLMISTLLKRASLIAPRPRAAGKGAGKGEAAEAEGGPQVVFYIRRFERVVQEDGSVVVRELKPEGVE